jgi:hypothetical protein
MWLFLNIYVDVKDIENLTPFLKNYGHIFSV